MICPAPPAAPTFTVEVKGDCQPSRDAIDAWAAMLIELAEKEETHRGLPAEVNPNEGR